MVSGRRILLLAPQDDRGSYRPLEEEGFTLSLHQEPLIVEEIPLDESPDLVVVDIALMPAEDLSAFLQRCKEVQLPVLAVVSQEHRSLLDPTLPVEDFIFSPLGDAELRIRVRHILWKTGSWDSGQVVRIGDLLIDQERYEISVAGRRVILTYKEYQLLCLLATNPGRVYSREALLSRVWGYDYFGGTRTVDVHIRRLRSKVEDATHLFIETVRNVGYRFRVA
jgi:DNA-binding response OmpR family regulator